MISHGRDEGILAGENMDLVAYRVCLHAHISTLNLRALEWFGVELSLGPLFLSSSLATLSGTP